MIVNGCSILTDSILTDIVLISEMILVCLLIVIPVMLKMFNYCDKIVHIYKIVRDVGDGHMMCI